MINPFEVESKRDLKEQRRGRIQLAVLSVLDVQNNPPSTTDEICLAIYRILREESYRTSEIEAAIEGLIQKGSLQYATARKTFDFRAKVLIRNYDRIKNRVAKVGGKANG